MGFKDDCIELFKTTNLYNILGLDDKTSGKHNKSIIKKAYYRKSLEYHPDKFKEEDGSEKTLATKKFQIVSKVYSILDDDERKQVYDESGNTGEDDEDTLGFNGWYSVWKKMFKPITKEEIDAYLATYIDSDEQKQDIVMCYNRHKGDILLMLESLIGFDVSNASELSDIVNEMIKDGTLEKTKKWKPLTAAKIKKMEQAKAKESIEAEEALKEIMKKEKSNNSLEEMILARGQKRQNEMILALETKYCQPKRRKTSKK
uniref:J domain-containing protein n=1 Tax=Rhabditophanes sp. KR3021 TaxID=114890 RepID=A0AC35UF23_9BILA